VLQIKNVRQQGNLGEKKGGGPFGGENYLHRPNFHQFDLFISWKEGGSSVMPKKEKSTLCQKRGKGGTGSKGVFPEKKTIRNHLTDNSSRVIRELVFVFDEEEHKWMGKEARLLNLYKYLKGN